MFRLVFDSTSVILLLIFDCVNVLCCLAPEAKLKKDSTDSMVVVNMIAIIFTCMQSYAKVSQVSARFV